MNWIAERQEKNLNEALGYEGSSSDLLDALWMQFKRQQKETGHPRFCRFCRWWKPKNKSGFSSNGMCTKDYQPAGWSDTCLKWETR
jgi:hypothetical protein